MTRSVLDYRPANEHESGAEPSLRDLVYKYYATHFDEPTALVLARYYCNQVEEWSRKQLTERMLRIC